MEDNCIFCKIAARKVAADIQYQDEAVTVFTDRQPAAPVHLLIIPNAHIASVNALREEDAGLLGHMFVVARKMAERYQVSEGGYRLVFNTGGNAGQTVYHLHLHLLGGERLPRLGHRSAG